MNKEQIGAFIKAERNKLGLSQKQFAKKAGITRYQQILEIEKAQFDYGINNLINLLNTLGYIIEIILPEDSRKTFPVRLVCKNTEYDFSKTKPAEEELNLVPAKEKIKIDKTQIFNFKKSKK